MFSSAFGGATKDTMNHAAHEDLGKGHSTTIWIPQELREKKGHEAKTVFDSPIHLQRRPEIHKPILVFFILPTLTFLHFKAATFFFVFLVRSDAPLCSL